MASRRKMRSPTKAPAPSCGWVYVLTNPAMPGLVKIGLTTRNPSARAAELTAVAHALDGLGLGDPARAVFRRLLADDSALRGVWPGGAPRMSDRLFALHAVRLCLIHRVWLLAVRVPDFSPRHGVTRADLLRRLLRLDVAGAADLLDRVFPSGPPPDGSTHASASSHRSSATPTQSNPPPRLEVEHGTRTRTRRAGSGGASVTR